MTFEAVTPLKDRATGAFSMHDCGQALGEVLGRLSISEPVVVVGTSWGGLVAGEFSLSHPRQTLAVVMLNTPILIDREPLAHRPHPSAASHYSSRCNALPRCLCVRRPPAGESGICQHRAVGRLPTRGRCRDGDVDPPLAVKARRH